MAHEHSIDKLTAVWLLPVVAPIVAAATGGNLCTVIPHDSPALQHTLVASYILWGTGVPFAMSILVLYIHRLTIYKVTPLRIPLQLPHNLFLIATISSLSSCPSPSSFSVFLVFFYRSIINSSSPPQKS